MFNMFDGKSYPTTCYFIRRTMTVAWCVIFSPLSYGACGVQVDVDNLGSISSTVVDISGGEFYEAYEEVRAGSRLHGSPQRRGTTS